MKIGYCYLLQGARGKNQIRLRRKGLNFVPV